MTFGLAVKFHCKKKKKRAVSHIRRWRIDEQIVKQFGSTSWVSFFFTINGLVADEDVKKPNKQTKPFQIATNRLCLLRIGIKKTLTKALYLFYK